MKFLKIYVSKWNWLMQNEIFSRFFFFQKIESENTSNSWTWLNSSPIIWTLSSWKLNFSLQYDKPTLQYKNTKITHQPDFI